MFFSTLAVLGSDGMPDSRSRTIFSKLKLHNERQARFKIMLVVLAHC